MVFKLVRVDAIEPYKVTLPLGSHFIGRGKFLDCNDNRVSRNHAELIVTSDSILLKSLHQNPCFVRKRSTSDTLIFSQPESQVLSNGDQFGLIPDKFWYEVILCQEDSRTNVVNVEVNNKSDNDNQVENGELETQTYDHQPEEDDNVCSQSVLGEIFDAPFSIPPESETSLPQAENRSDKLPADDPHNMDITTAERQEEFTNHNDATTDQTSVTSNHSSEHSNHNAEPTNHNIESIHENIETGDQNTKSQEPIASSSHNLTPTKRIHSEEDSPCDLKRVKTEPADVSSKDSVVKTQLYKADEIVGTASNQSIKIEPSSTGDTTAGPSADQGGSAAGPAGAPPSPAKPPPTKQLRERCMYGASCYRRNPHHKAQFSHPTDTDWGVGPQAECPWGARCVRLDPRHWRDHTHPPGTLPPRGNRPGRRQRRPRPPPSPASDSDDGQDNVNLIVAGKRVRRQVVRQAWSESDDDEDPFATDESDEWEPPDDVSQHLSQDSGLQSQDY